jgi:hypothetical protein
MVARQHDTYYILLNTLMNLDNDWDFSPNNG